VLLQKKIKNIVRAPNIQYNPDIKMGEERILVDIP
jgi:hypothetical protein